MTGAEILALLKDVGGYGLAAFFAWMWLQERARHDTSREARLADVKDFGMKAVAAIDNNTHAMERLAEVVKAKS